MADRVSQAEINDIAWRACDTFRGTLDPAQYKDYILVMLFIKYMSDLWKDKREQYENRYQGDAQRVERALARERFVVPPEADFDYLYAKRRESNIGELINIALEKIEDANKAKLENVFRNIDFNSEPHLGQTRERNRRLVSLLDDFANPKLDLRPSRIGNQDVIGNTYEYLISRFASDAGKKGGEFYTPPEVATLLARLLEPQSGARICDPACGSGSLLIRVARQIGDRNFALFGQESNGSTWALCRMNMFLHEMDNARIEWCNTITNPRLVEGDSLMKFNIVVANPPFSLDKWGADEAANDRFHRFWRAIPPQSKGDYAFISHMVETALADEGRVGVIVPHGVLFRGGAEGKIRQQMIEENVLKVVVGLPPNLFFGTSIPAAILIFDKGKKHKDVLLIDASREYLNDKNQNKLRDQDIEKIVETYQCFETKDNYAYRATFDEIKENDFNLNISRYVDTFEEEEEVDILAVQREIEQLEADLALTRQEMAGYLKELGYAS
jgi:type I restriction enzyme M protein